MTPQTQTETLKQEMPKASLKIFATCPQSSAVAKESYLEEVAAVARWSEEYGCKGILVYTDNSLVDPWLVAQFIIQHTEILCPLVAVQPIYMHPYTVAKMVTTFGYLYGRRIYLNMVAGGFTNDLIALNDTTPHDRRYDRVVEYTTMIKRLLDGGSPVTYDGEFYKAKNLKLTPALAPDLSPGIFMSGSSDAGLAAARALGATAVMYPKPAEEYESARPQNMDSGIRVGIITREGEEQSWSIAHERFPEDRKGQLTRQLADKVSDSVWHKQLAQLNQTTENNPYWLVPFNNYKTMCPYLVGSYDRVAKELARYIAVGYKTFILDIPPSEEELYHTSIVFRRARDLCAK